MFADDPFNKGKPEPRAFKFILPVKALKYAKQFAGVFHIKAGPVVFHIIHMKPWIVYNAYFYLWFFFF